MKRSDVKICLVCSSGGHLAQLHRLRPWWDGMRRFWVTFDEPGANSLLAGERVYHCFHPTNRNIPNLLRNTWLAWKVLRRERPDLIVSTGAAVAVPFFYVGKLLGMKTVFIEIFDRVDKPTLTGRLVRPVADRIFVQWPEMTGVYPGSIYAGSVF